MSLKKKKNHWDFYFSYSNGIKYKLIFCFVKPSHGTLQDSGLQRKKRFVYMGGYIMNKNEP